MSTTRHRRGRAIRPVLPATDLFERISDCGDAERRELLHEHAYEELETGYSRKGVYAMALTSSDGDRDRAEARYVRLRVDQLEDEYASWEEDRLEAEEEDALRAEASADFLRTISAVAFFILSLVAILSWT